MRALVELVFHREALLVVEHFDAEIVALLPELFAAWLTHTGHHDDLVRGDVHLELINWRDGSLAAQSFKECLQ